jgi:hypothetical protein
MLRRAITFYTAHALLVILAGVYLYDCTAIIRAGLS